MSSKPRLLDLFCGAGGAAVGYHRAGFEVVGVDIKAQPRYPFEFVQVDALHFVTRMLDHLDPVFGWALFDFDAIHASPPCQFASSITGVTGNRDEHPNLIPPIRALLLETGLPYVIENVDQAKAHLRNPIRLCGVALGLALDDDEEGRFVLRRHRWFETNWMLMSPGCGCHRGDGTTLGIYGGGTRQDTRKEANPNGGNTRKANRVQGRALMEMPWATRAELTQAIPPAYTELIGYQLLQHVRAGAAA